MSERCPRCGWEFNSHGVCDVCDDYDFDADEEDPDCLWCGGHGWVECSDPIECTREHDAHGYCQCGSCGGSGLRKDMTIW